MSTRSKGIAAYLARIQDLIEREPSGGRVLTDTLDQLIGQSGESARVLGIVGARGSQRLASARFAADLLTDGEALAQRPAVEEDLAVMEWALRPAIPISGLQSAASEGIWPVLSKLDLSLVLDRVCRIDIGKEGDRLQAGSGIILDGVDGRFTVATAAHVLIGLRAWGWGADDEIKAWAVLGEDASATNARAITLQPFASTHSSQDLALLYAAEQEPLKELVRIKGQAAPGAPLAVLGYPFFDSRRDDWARDFGFRDQPGVLRISPGVLLGVRTRMWNEVSVTMLTHDASTLSGSSGSAVLDLPTLSLCGIHVGGWQRHSGDADQPFVSNAAVPADHLDHMPAQEGIYLLADP